MTFKSKSESNSINAENEISCNEDVELTEVDGPLQRNGDVPEVEAVPRNWEDLTVATKKWISQVRTPSRTISQNLRAKTKNGEIFVRQFKDGDLKGNSILHCAVILNQVKLFRLFKHFKAVRNGIGLRNEEGKSCLDIAAGNNSGEILGKILEMDQQRYLENDRKNKLDTTSAVQIAAELGHYEAVKVLLDHKIGDYREETGQSLLHRACNGHSKRLSDLRNKFDPSRLVMNENADDIEKRLKNERNDLEKRTFPLLKHLLGLYQNSPEILDQPSFGPILHSFAQFNYVEGIEILLSEPYNVNVNQLDEDQASALNFAAYRKHFELAKLLVENGADPNWAFNNKTPLHFAIEGYHQAREQVVTDFIDALLEKGADPTLEDKSGEAPIHLAVYTLNFAIMAKFIDHLGPDVFEQRDNDGNGIFHYAAGKLDSNAITNMVKRGANLMSRSKPSAYTRQTSSDEREIVVYDIPLMEAVKNGNGGNYLDTMLMLNLDEIWSGWSVHDQNSFLCSHLIAAAMEFKPFVIRKLLQRELQNPERLHRILTFTDKHNEQRLSLFGKTGLQWAVENKDQVSVTEILHKEFECHRESRENGLKCLREQLINDEILSWTADSFSRFYEKSRAEKIFSPFMSVCILVVTLVFFVFDIVTDIFLTVEYWELSQAMNSSHATHNLTLNDTQCLESYSSNLTSGDFKVAFITTITCCVLPIIPFTIPTHRELKEKLEPKLKGLPAVLAQSLLVVLSVFLSPVAPIYAFVQFARYKWRHTRARRKHKFRGELEKYEHFWATLRISESGIESSGQLILQAWLLSRSLDVLMREKSVISIFRSSLDGFFYFITQLLRTGEDASGVEKSLGKILISIVGLMLSVSGCYKISKRGAIPTTSMFWMWASYGCQILARMIAICFFFYPFQDFVIVLPMILTHFVIIATVKMTLEKGFFDARNFFAGSLSVVSSSLIFVRVKTDSSPSLHQSTFILQFISSCIFFIENVILGLVPKFLATDDDISQLDSYWGYFWLMIGNSVLGSLSLICHYRCKHPWAAILQPELSNSYINLNVFCCQNEGNLYIRKRTQQICDDHVDSASLHDANECCSCPNYIVTYEKYCDP